MRASDLNAFRRANLNALHLKSTGAKTLFTPNFAPRDEYAKALAV